jgi:hypothetical protein
MKSPHLQLQPTIFSALHTSHSSPRKRTARLIGFALTWPPYLDKRLDMYPTFDRILRRGGEGDWVMVAGAIGKDMERWEK